MLKSENQCFFLFLSYRIQFPVSIYLNLKTNTLIDIIESLYVVFDLDSIHLLENMYMITSKRTLPNILHGNEHA